MSASEPVARDEMGVRRDEEAEAEEDENVKRGKGGGWFVPSMRITVSHEHDSTPHRLSAPDSS